MLKLQYLFLCGLLVVASDLLAVEPSFTPLPDLPGGDVQTFISALSANGRVAVGFSRGEDQFGYPFRWTKDSGMIALSASPGHANGVSADGSVIVGRRSLANPPRPAVAFRWTEANGFVNLPDLGQPNRSHAHSVSADGTTVAGISSDRAVRWVADGQPMDLGVATTLEVFISADGSVASGTQLGTRAFRWTEAEGPTPLLGLPEQGESSVTDMTPDGRVIVGFISGGVAGFRWIDGDGVSSLLFIPRSVSDDGRTIVGIGSGDDPVLWTEATGHVELQPFLTGLGLNLTGWTLNDVTAISGDGTTIAGHGIPPNPAMSGAWVAVIPEPPTWVLAASTLAVVSISSFHVAARRRRSQNPTSSAISESRRWSSG